VCRRAAAVQIRVAALLSVLEEGARSAIAVARPVSVLGAQLRQVARRKQVALHPLEVKQQQVALHPLEAKQQQVARLRLEAKQQQVVLHPLEAKQQRVVPAQVGARQAAQRARAPARLRATSIATPSCPLVGRRTPEVA
jgi:hypothetical protein